MCWVLSALAAPQQPQFRSSVERIVIDLQVVDREGRPIPQLTAADFEVKIGQGRRVVASAEFVRAARREVGGGAASAGTAEDEPPRAVGRDFILAIDESSFRTQNASAAFRDRMPYVAEGPRGREWIAASNRIRMRLPPRALRNSLIPRCAAASNRKRRSPNCR